MKISSIYIALTIFITGLIACSVEELAPINTFVKLVGEDQSSEGNKLMVLDNGETLIFGKTGTSAFDITGAAGSGIFVGGNQDSGASITRIDAEGNVLDRRVYPLLSTIELESFIPANVQNLATFKDAIATSDQGYMIIGEWQGVPLRFSSDNAATTEPVNVPFLVKVNQDLEVVHFEPIASLQADLFGLNSTLFEFPNGRIGIFYGIAATRQGINGYAIKEYSEDGSSLLRTQINTTNQATIKLGNSIEFDSNGDPLVLGQQFGRIVIYKLDPVTLQEVSILDVADDDQFVFNNNSMKLMRLSDGRFLTVYSAAPQDVRIIFHDNQLRMTGSVIIEADRQDDYYRHITELSDGTLLLSNVNILSEVFNSVYRLSSNGIRMWRREFEGYNGGIAETLDGNLLVVSNPFYNNHATKATIRKIAINGTQ